MKDIKSRQWTDRIYNLLYIRKFEEALLKLFHEGKIAGTTHTCIGQEEVPLAIMPHLTPTDFIFSNHRGHGHYLARFRDAKGLLAEIMGKTGAVCHGTGGSQHIRNGNYLSTGIQGESIPVAAGIAWHFKQEKNNSVAVCFIGDGTWGQGVIYESLNMVSLLKVPLIIVCENNGIAQSTLIKNNLAGSIEARVAAFGIDYIFFKEISNTEENNKKLESAFLKVRKQNEPLVIEIITNRLAAHSKGDDSRSLLDIENLKRQDWYALYSQANDELFKEIEGEVETDIHHLVTEISNRENAKLYLNLSKTEPENNFDSNLGFIPETILENLNQSLHNVLAENINTIIIGEDISDPYGGAFKATKGLSDRFPSQVISSPISEAAMAGFGNGLAMAGRKTIVEFMFADFAFLAADQILNFASKTVSNYGKKYDHPIVFRCPVGGKRGYGSTHSQSIQKHFVGVPNLYLYELSPLHDTRILLPYILDTGNPSILFEEKSLYPVQRIPEGSFNKFFHHQKLDFLTSHICISKHIDILLITGGGLIPESLDVCLQLFLRHEISVHIINPFLIYPFDFSGFTELISKASLICTIEEGTDGGLWGSEVIRQIHSHSEFKSKNAMSISSADSIIPNARHQEEEILISVSTIINKILDHYSN